MPKFNASTILAIVAAILISAGITTMYLSAESGLYWSDYNYYQFILKTVRDALIENPLTGLALIVYSTKLLYNFLFTIPLLPVSLIFGDNRFAFIVSQVILFQIPAAILLASLINYTLKTRSNRIFWISFTIFMSQPAIWACSLRGYPDCIAFAFLLLSFHFCQKMQENPTLKNTLATGIFLALAPFLRRHYAYGAIAAATSFFAVFYQEPAREICVIVANFVHLALGHTVKRADYLIKTPTKRVVSGYDLDEEFWESIEQTGGSIVVVGRGIVGNAHLHRIPFDLAFDAESNDAEEHPFDEGHGVIEIGASGIAACASATL